jgi:PKD repeat protein
MTRAPARRVDGGGRGLGAALLLLSLVGVAVATTAPAAPATAAVATASTCPHRTAPAGILGVVPARSTSGCTTGVSSGPAARLGVAASNQQGYQGGAPPLSYLGGPVVGTAATTGENSVHALFWSPSGYAYPAGYQNGIDTYLNDVAAASGSASNVYGVATQFWEGQPTGSPHIHYDVHVGAPVAVADPYPSGGGCSPDSGHGEGYSACVTDAQIQSEMDSVLALDHLPTGLGDVYLMVFPPNVETCTSPADAAGGGLCSDTAYSGFCGYHSASFAGTGIALYADITYPTGFRYTCMGREAPNHSLALDSTLTMVSHEHNETITDPLGDGWIDSLGNEDGDECAWNFGSSLGGTPGAQWNQLINGDHYELQQEFSNEDYAQNAANGCALTQSLPTASLVVTTTRPAVGLPMGFDGSGSSVANVPNGISNWTWNFGDGTATASGPTPTHTYATGGSYPVTLSVTDTDGYTAQAAAWVTVGSSSPIAFTTASPPGTATVGISYQYTFATSGSPGPTYSLSGAPGWLGIGGNSGTVSGVPPAGTSSFSFSVVASNPVGPPATVGPFAVSVTATASHLASLDGYWLVGSDGGIFAFGSAGFHGSTGGLPLQRPVVGISPTADRQGYWLVGSDGGVFAFGDAGYFGSLPGLGFAPAGAAGRSALSAPIVAMVPSSDGGGYFMVASDGGVFAFGDARFAGSCPGIGGCSGPAVAVMPDSSGNGYWLVTGTGDVYAFGDAPYLGAPPVRFAWVTSAVRTPDGGGYWILYGDGRLSGFGDAGRFGDPQGALAGDTATSVFATTDGGGYWVATARGAVYAYGDAPADGSMAGAHLNGPVVAASGW